MKAIIAVSLLVACAAAQSFNRPAPAWLNYDLMKYQGPYAGGQYYGQIPMGFLGRRSSYNMRPSTEVPPPMPLLNPFSGVLSLDQLVKLPLFHEYLDIPLFKQYFSSQEFQQYLTSALFQDYWTNPLFQQLFMDSSLFYKYVFPVFHKNTEAQQANNYYDLSRDMLAPGPMMYNNNNEDDDQVDSYQVQGDEPSMASTPLSYNKAPHSLMVFLMKNQVNPEEISITEKPTEVETPLFHVPLTKDDSNNANILDNILAEKIVRAVMSQYGPEAGEKKTNAPKINIEDIKLTYDSIIPTNPEDIQEAASNPEIDPKLVTLQEPAESETETMEKKKMEMINYLKEHKRFSRFGLPKKYVEHKLKGAEEGFLNPNPSKYDLTPEDVPAEIKLIGAEESTINNMKYETTPEVETPKVMDEEQDTEEQARTVRQSPAYETVGSGGLEAVPLSLSPSVWNSYAGASGAETPVEKAENESFNGA